MYCFLTLCRFATSPRRNISPDTYAPPVSSADITPKGGLILWTKVKFILFAKNSSPPRGSARRARKLY
jgi:hypothetical protein